MEWDKDAEQAVAKVPFFVRKRVKKRVETEAQQAGATRVTMTHVTACKQQYLHHQEDEVQGFTVESCFGQSGCPNRIDTGKNLSPHLEALLRTHKLKEFMQSRVPGPLKLHHEFRITLADCPNGCSRPQIVDIGLISASLPTLSDAPCSECGACLAACKEEAITLNAGPGPQFDWQRCLACGQCARACPTGTIAQDLSGYRILLGGKLGRHPRLGQELSGIFSAETTLTIIDTCLTHFKAQNKEGERFGELLNRTGLAFLAPYTLKTT
ncbi:MAG: 4Fe-4S dicluster domain-containing protein [Deltaproteobacteria bacterium]|nr:4Fe-4S dicluster domain-containing protein [Deltaproteobacteria bacterium]